MTIKTPEQIARETLNTHYSGVVISVQEMALISWMQTAIEADRAQIAQALAEESHHDDWGVPCVDVEGFCERNLGIEIEVP